MKYWLMKSEPDVYSIDNLERDRNEIWDGVRNYQARNNMRAMKLGDKGFFYHSNEGLDVVGIVEVCAEIHPDSTTDDERWECVDIKAVCDMPNPVSLKDVKANPARPMNMEPGPGGAGVLVHTVRHKKITADIAGRQPGLARRSDEDIRVVLANAMTDGNCIFRGCVGCRLPDFVRHFFKDCCRKRM